MNAIDIIKNDKVLIKMNGNTGGWTTNNGVKFSPEKPFNLVTIEEASVLLLEDRFEEGDPEEARKFYGIKK